MFFTTCSLTRVVRSLRAANPEYVVICGTGSGNQVRFIAFGRRTTEVTLRTVCYRPRLWVKVPMRVLENAAKVAGQIMVVLENNERYGLHLYFEGEVWGVRHRLKAADLGEEILPPLVDLRKQGLSALTRRR